MPVYNLNDQSEGTPGSSVAVALSGTTIVATTTKINFSGSGYDVTVGAAGEAVVTNNQIGMMIMASTYNLIL